MQEVSVNDIEAEALGDPKSAQNKEDAAASQSTKTFELTMAGTNTERTSNDQDKEAPMAFDNKNQVLDSNELGSAEKPADSQGVYIGKKHSTEKKRMQDSNDGKLTIDEAKQSLAESFKARRSTSLYNVQLLGLN